VFTLNSISVNKADYLSPILIGDIMTTCTETQQQRLASEILRKQGALKQILLEWLQVAELKIKVYRERQKLLLMSDLMLNDIGITRTQANAEALSSEIPAERLISLAKENC
jgi:uncharacterized protein YjiS (DUF1127 family)